MKRVTPYKSQPLRVGKKNAIHFKAAEVHQFRYGDMNTSVIIGSHHRTIEATSIHYMPSTKVNFINSKTSVVSRLRYPDSLQADNQPRTHVSETQVLKQK